MASIKSKLYFIFARFLMRRSWGRRLLLQWAMRSIRQRVLSFWRDLAEICPVMRSAESWL